MILEFAEQKSSKASAKRFSVKIRMAKLAFA